MKSIMLDRIFIFAGRWMRSRPSVGFKEKWGHVFCVKMLWIFVL